MTASTTTERARHAHRMALIVEDMRSDVLAFEGKPFNGKNVSEMYGNVCAAIAAIADTMRFLLEDKAER